MAKEPYADRTDLEKVQSQWHKLSGLHTREEWSAAIVRAATATEISANYAIRCEFATQSQLPAHFVDSTLRWANGLAGKVEKLLLPLTKASIEKHAKIKQLRHAKGGPWLLGVRATAAASTWNLRAFPAPSACGGRHESKGLSVPVP